MYLLLSIVGTLSQGHTYTLSTTASVSNKSNFFNCNHPASSPVHPWHNLFCPKVYSTTIIIHASINSNLNHPVTLFYLPQQPLIPSTTTAIRTPAYQPQQPLIPSTTTTTRTPAYQPQQPFIPSTTTAIRTQDISLSTTTTVYTIQYHNI